nr:RNA-directed RNA polymerase [Ipomoea batatas]GME04262.1 RNA-directed RNA polymerase [Ipomoea batatas]
MGWLQSLFSPLKKLWVRLHSPPKKRRGIYILYEDVKSCPYEDVHVLCLRSDLLPSGSDETFALLGEAIALVGGNIGGHSNIEKAIKGISFVLDISQYGSEEGNCKGGGSANFNSLHRDGVAPGYAVTNRRFLGVGSANKDVKAIRGDEDANQSSQPRSVHSVVVRHHHRRQVAGAHVAVALHRRENEEMIGSKDSGNSHCISC